MASKWSLRRISLCLAVPALALLTTLSIMSSHYRYSKRKSKMIQIVGDNAGTCQIIDESGPDLNVFSVKSFWLNLQCTALVDVRGREKWTKDSNATYATLPGSEVSQPYDPGTLECFLSNQPDAPFYYRGSYYRACRAKHLGNWKVAVYWYDDD
jgi:hypothetical protein